jgi:uncharacterized membrane protein
MYWHAGGNGKHRRWDHIMLNMCFLWEFGSDLCAGCGMCVRPDRELTVDTPSRGHFFHFK